MNCHTTIGNGIVGLSLNFSRPISRRLPTNVATRYPARARVILGNTSGRIVNRITTSLHTCHHPRPCGNGNIHCTSRIIHAGRTGGGWNGAVSGGSTHVHHTAHTHHGLRRLNTAHLIMRHAPHRVCTRMVTPGNSRILMTTSAMRGTVTRRLGCANGGSTTTTINGTITRHTLRGNVGSMSFSHSKFRCRNHIRTLTSTTHRTNLRFWNENME